MSVHLIKLSVGTQSIQTLTQWQNDVAERRGAEGLPAFPDHITRMRPKRTAEILETGGSIYWVIKGSVLCRNKIREFGETHTQDGRAACRIVLEPGLFPVVPTLKRAFQGWRYLAPEDAPADLSSLGDAADLPPSLRAKLSELGVW